MSYFKWFFAAVVCCLLIDIVNSIDTVNYLVNPGFENDLEGWENPNDACEIVTDVVHSGTKALHCKDDSTSKRERIRQKSIMISGGVRYNISAWIKLKNVVSKGSDKATLLICLVNDDYEYDIYSWNIPDCVDGTCTSKWYFLSGVSNEPFDNSSKCSLHAMLYDTDATGEFWLDDLSVEEAAPDLLAYIETTAWRQEVFEDKIEIYVNLLINGTKWSDGKDLSLKVDLVDSDGKVVDTLSDYELGYREDNRIATFVYDPTPLKPGYYKVRATLVNKLYDNYEQTIETNVRKLEKKRNLSFYVDQKTMIAYDEGKKFFPMGLYADNLDDSDIDTITEGPFNLVISGDFSKKKMDHIYNYSNGRLRVINIVYPYVRATTDPAQMEEYYNNIVRDIEQWNSSKGLFGYYISDEPNKEATPALRNVTLTIRERDPNHVVFAAVNKRKDLHIIKEGLDAIGIDCYPVQNYDALHAVYTMGIQARARTCNARPLWNIPQIFDWEAYGESNEAPPTEQQMRQMTYQFIASGGMGIIYYDYSLLHKMNKKNPFETEWGKVKRVANELVDYYVPIILSGYPGSPRFNLPYYQNRVGWRKFYNEGYSYFLIVNLRDQEYTYSFTKPSDVAESDIEMIMGSSAMTFSDNTVTLKMPSTDVVWLRILDEKWTPDQKHDDPESSQLDGSGSIDGSIFYIPSCVLIVISIISVLFIK